jgi:hypothetical protein
MRAALDTARAAIKAKLLSAPVIASDETTTRVNGVTHWQWVFLSDQVVPCGPQQPNRLKSTVLILARIMHETRKHDAETLHYQRLGSQVKSSTNTLFAKLR